MSSNGQFDRRSGRKTSDSSSRTGTHRDRDRVLYSEAFRRLGGVTQVALGSPTMTLHNRLTHSLKVEQVGVSIYTHLQSASNDSSQLDQHAIAAACLAHDLGHPPFGHAGEQELDSLVVCENHQKVPKRTIQVRLDDPCRECKLEDGFEGNAQSLRIIAVLAVHRDSAKNAYGLDMTRAALAATIKYPWLRGAPGKKPNKWGAYDCDKDILEWAMGSSEDPSLNAQVMDWADDISYAVHDIEDFFRAGLIPLDDYKQQTKTADDFLEYIQSPDALGSLTQETKDALDQMYEQFPRARFAGDTNGLAALDRLRGLLLSQFIGSVSLSDHQLVFDDAQRQMNAVLKQLIWYHIIHEPKLAAIQVGQRRVLREIFENLEALAMDAYKIGAESDNPDAHSLRRLPHGLLQTLRVSLAQDSTYKRLQKIYRGILDYIASLSDAEAYQLHAVLKGRDYAGHL